MSNLFSNLYQWLHRQDENFVTETFAFILRRLLEGDRTLGNTLVRWLCFPANSPVSLDGQEWDVSLQVTSGKEGRPDIWLRSAKAFLLVEVKRRSGLGKEQLERYRRILDQSGAEIKQLVLLTESPVEIGVNAEKPDYEVRWHKVAEWLRSHPCADPVACFLTRQFIDFLEDERIAVKQVGQEYLAGVEAFLRLVTMLEKALEDCNLPFRRSFQKYQFGFYLKKPTYKAFFVGIKYSNPKVLRFRFDEAEHDEAKFAALRAGRIAEGKPVFVFQLDERDPDFFTLSADDQIKLISEFIKSSFEKATGCINIT